MGRQRLKKAWQLELFQNPEGLPEGFHQSCHMKFLKDKLDTLWCPLDAAGFGKSRTAITVSPGQAFQ